MSTYCLPCGLSEMTWVGWLIHSNTLSFHVLILMYSEFWVLKSRHKPFNLLLYDSKLQISSSEAVSVKNSSNQKRTYSRTQNGCVESYRKKFLIRTSKWCWLGGALGQSNLKGISLNWSTWFRFNRFIRINKNEETWWKKRQSDRFQVRAFTVKSKMDRIQLFIKICH